MDRAQEGGFEKNADVSLRFFCPRQSRLNIGRDLSGGKPGDPPSESFAL